MKGHPHITRDRKPDQVSMGIRAKHLLKIFVLYLIIAGAVAGWIDYSSYGVFNPLWMALGALAVAVLATAVHGYTRAHDRIDDVADDDL